MKTDNKKIMKYTIFAIAVIACIFVWPIGVIKNTKTVQTGVEYNHFTEPLSGGVYAVQDFIAGKKHLEKLILIFNKDTMTNDEGDLQVRLLDETDQILQTWEIPIETIQPYEDTEIYVDVDLSPGKKYRWAIESMNTNGDGPCLVYRSKQRAGIDEIGMLSYFGIAELPDAVAMMRLEYVVGLKWYQIIIYDSFILLLAELVIKREKAK